MESPDLETRSKDKIIKQEKFERMEVSITRANGRLGRKWKRGSGNKTTMK